MKDLMSRFGLHSIPFTCEIPVDQCITLPHCDETLEAFVRVIDQRMSGALIAPAGTGKTTLVRRLVSLLPEARYRVHYVKVTDLNEIASLGAMMTPGLAVDGELKSSGKVLSPEDIQRLL